MADKKKNSLGRQIAKNKAAYFLAAPFLLLFLAFVVVPLIITVLLAFCSYDMTGLPSFAAFDNFRSLFSFGSEFPTALENSMIIFSAVGLGGFVLCFFAAWGMEFLPKRIADIITYALFVMSLIGTIIAAVWLSGGLLSPLNSLLLSLKLSDVCASWLSDERYALLCVIFSQLWTTFGLGFLALRSGFQSVSREKIEAAKIEGIKNPLWTLLYAYIPSILPQITFAAAVQIAYAFTNSEILRILSGTSADNFAAHGILTYIFNSGEKLDAGRACAANLILLAVMTVIYAAVRLGIKLFSKRENQCGRRAEDKSVEVEGEK